MEMGEGHSSHTFSAGSPDEGQWAVGMTAGSWCGRIPLDSGLSVEFPFIGDGGAPSLIHLLPLFCCEFKAVA